MIDQDKPGRDISAELDKIDPRNDLVYYPTSVTITVSRPKSSWQQERVIKYLKEMYPDGRLPRPTKWLLARLAKRDQKLKSLDWKTLRRAMDAIRRATISGNET